MRLICPNCDAQYEVSDDAIPPEGRDVQCSNCGHGWFQRSSAFVAAQPTIPAPVPEPDAAWRAGAWPQTDPAPFPAPEPFLRPRPEPAEPEPTAELAPSVEAEPAPGPDPVADAAAPPADPLPPEDEDQEAPPPAPAVAPPSRSLDGSLLAMLREEAEREAEQRRQEGVAPTSPVAVPATPDSGPADAPPVPGPVLAEPMPRPRRDLLPDIEEINSTLRTGTARPAETSDVPPEVPRPSRGPYRAGFFLMILAALLLATGYLMAPQIAAEMPGAEPALRTYVAAVDEARLLLDRLLRAALTALQGAAA